LQHPGPAAKALRLAVASDFEGLSDAPAGLAKASGGPYETGIRARGF
jgi:hypothetical protein